MEATLHSGMKIIGGPSEKTRKILFAAPPSSNYSRLSEGLRKNIPTEIQCVLFCGGNRCKYESSDCWTKEDMAIDGIFSHWVTEEILAMSRPSTCVILNKNVIDQFKRKRIQSIINLQQPGEHSKCGPPLENCGFSYDPEIFMKEGIYFYNFSMKDYGEAGESRILDMVKVMSFAISEGKVAIHCHAGLGRTGVLIACYLIFHLKVSANQAMQFVRSKRPNSIQTRSQIQCCQQFERYVLSLCDIFSNKEGAQEKKGPELTLATYLKRQQLLLHGYETKHFKYIPKILFIVGESLLKLAHQNTIDLEHQWPQFTGNYLVADACPFNNKIMSKLSELECITSELEGQGSLVAGGKDNTIPEKEAKLPVQAGSGPLEGSNSGTNSQVCSSETMMQAILSDHSQLSEKDLALLVKFKARLTHQPLSWNTLTKETNPVVLTGLLFEWIEHLSKPLLGKDELSYIVILGHKPVMCLKKFPSELQYTLEYLFRLIHRMFPESEESQSKFLRRMMASFTHQAIAIDGQLFPGGKNFPKLREGTLRKVMEFGMAFMELLKK
ncbi:protein tyrosine phosphatase domain-containing protein 1-like [Ischnura elegans]|uniref:protein tyrosine phosphatase domain-containing protein 1-like n=1 Tax=Ischnura elegans TaxID=197161 RepID=UPI001ED8ABD3|nr:protein tyrosine phosphatase domain-containing protein 1-like [Ischnura elegans]